MNPETIHQGSPLDFDYVYDVDNEAWTWRAKLTPAERVHQEVMEAFYADRDGKVREALIAMGWTPPTDEKQRARQ